MCYSIYAYSAILYLSLIFYFYAAMIHFSSDSPDSDRVSPWFPIDNTKSTTMSSTAPIILCGLLLLSRTMGADQNGWMGYYASMWSFWLNIASIFLQFSEKLNK